MSQAPAPSHERPAGWLSDVRALLDGRRLLPTAAVAAALVSAELLAGFGVRGAAVALGMSLAFVLFAPAWYCRWFRSEAGLPGWLRGVLYVAGCALLVATCGISLPLMLASRGSLLTDAAGWPVSMVLFAVGGWGLGRDILLAQSLEAAERRGLALQREVEHTRLLAIQRQLDPHFLFNTLNAIAEWCRQDAEVAEAATLKLAALLRSMLGGLETEQWPLSQEIELMEQLFELHRIRDPAQLTFVIEGDRDADVSVPALLLLPLAENAMTHGPRAGHSGQVRVTLSVGERVCVQLDNPGALGAPRAGGRGLVWLRRRLQLAYGAAAQLELAPCPDDATRTRASVSWPNPGASVAQPERVS